MALRQAGFIVVFQAVIAAARACAISAGLTPEFLGN
jgi:hypothetical protein